MRILVTGASGFIGRRFLERASSDHEIVATWRSSVSFPDFVATLGGKRIRPLRVDLSDPLAVRRAAVDIGGDFDVLLHLAANGDPARSIREPAVDLDETLRTALITFEAFRARRLVLFSSGAVYEGATGPVDPRTTCRPVLPYAVTHFAAEQYAEWFAKQGHFEHHVVLRFFGAYGPHEPERKIYSRLCQAFAFEKNDEFVLRGDGQNMIDAMYVDDTVAAVDAVLRSEATSGVWDLASGAPMTLQELVERAAAIFDVAPIRIQYEGEASERHEFRASSDGFAASFGFRPSIPLERGLPELASWLRRQG